MMKAIVIWLCAAIYGIVFALLAVQGGAPDWIAGPLALNYAFLFTIYVKVFTIYMRD